MILLIFKIRKLRNIGFVRNLIVHMYWNFYEEIVVL